MFESLYFKDVLDEEVGKCLAKRYAGTTVNDRSLGKMYYLKQFSKYADEMYNQLRSRIDPKGAVDKKIVENDGQFSAEAYARAGSNKVDPDLLIAAVAPLILATATAAGTELTEFESRMQARALIARCSTRSKDSVVITVVENGNA